MGFWEHRIVFLKELQVKIVYPKELGDGESAVSHGLFRSKNEKATAMVAFCVSVLWWRLVYFQFSELGGVIWQIFEVGPGMGFAVLTPGVGGPFGSTGW
jgi:hypothetical protein